MLKVTLCGLIASSTSFDVSPQDMLDSNTPNILTEAPVDPCSLVDSPAANASVQLSSWLECAVNGLYTQCQIVFSTMLTSRKIGFYPYPANTDWPKGHATSFSKDIRFTFNDTHYDFDGSLRLYTTFNATLGVAFAPFKHGFIHSLGIPNINGDKGGFVYMIGWAGGFQTRVQRDLYFTNAAFAVVKEEQGERKIVEFRESSNIPNTAHLPEAVEWACSFD
jgi:hypothetical protein